VLFLIQATAHAANLVVGGGFVNPDLIDGGAFPPNWQVSASNPATVRVNTDPIRDTDGDDWYAFLLAGNFAPTGAYIYQVVSVVPSTLYDFEFDATYNGGARDLRVDVFDGDLTGHADFLNDLLLTGDLFAQTVDLVSTYQQYGQTGLTPTQNQVTIRFWDMEQSTATAGIWLDDVQLNGLVPSEDNLAVPEPSSIAMATLGLILGLLALRQPRRRQVD
jgi:hypothetical protein